MGTKTDRRQQKIAEAMRMPRPERMRDVSTREIIANFDTSERVRVRRERLQARRADGKAQGPAAQAGTEGQATPR